MKTVKRLCSLLFVLTLLSTLSVPAFADLIWEPIYEPNAFLVAHRGECRSVSGIFVAQTDTHFYSDPETQTIAGELSAGYDLLLIWIWTDAAGEEWGFDGSSQWADSYWVRMADFRQLYTESVFYEEHADEIVSETGALPFSTERAFVSYTYPGSGKTSTRFGGVDSIGAADPNFRYDRTYTDEAGRKWGAATYSGRYRFWICLSDPYNDALPRTAPKYADESPVLQRAGRTELTPVEPIGPIRAELPPGEKPPVEAASVGNQPVSDGETAPAVPTPVEPIAPTPVAPTPVAPTPAEGPAEGPDGTEEYEIFEATVGTDAPPAQPAEGVEHPGTPGEIGASPAPATPEAVAPEQVLHAGLIAGLVAAAVAASAALLLILRRKKRD